RKAQEHSPKDNYSAVYPFNDGFSVVKKASGMGLLDSNGKEIIACSYDSIGTNFANGRLAIQQKGKWALFNTKGQQLSPFKYLHIGYAKEGRIPFQNEQEKWGYLNMDGNIVIPPQFKYASDFSEGLAFCMLGDTIGYIDTMGLEVVPFQHFKYGG